MPRDTLDPEVRAFADAMTAAWASYPDYRTLTLPEARAIAEKVREPWRQGGPIMARTEERVVETSTGPLRTRFHYPTADSALPALFYLHGGGFTLFSIDSHDRLMREYAAGGGFVVIGIDYPLAPEAKYPVALEQTVELVRWAATNAAALHVDASRLAIGGDSAGGNLSVAACLKLRDAGESGLLKAMLLNYGGFTNIVSDGSEAAHGGPGAVLNREECAYFWNNYLRGPEDAADPFAIPLLADVSGLPPSFLVVAEQDVVAENSLLMAERLEQAGNAVSLKVYAGAAHSFLEAMSVSALAREAIAEGAKWVRAQLGDQKL